MAMVDKLIPNDPRVQLKTTQLNGRTYGYVLGEPLGPKRGTIFLIHGFPDLSFGWRYQIPMLMELGLRVVAPDMMGYGRTDAPPYTIQAYTFKQAADDMNELATQLGESSIIACGHDWGGAIAPRFALFYPDLVTHLITICTPYIPPSGNYIPLPVLTSTAVPTLTYQLQFSSGILEEHIPATPFGVQQFLRTLYGGRNPSNRKHGFKPGGTGIDLDTLPSIGPSPLFSPEEEAFYISEYTRNKPVRDPHPLHGPLNWYRTRELNHTETDLPLLSNRKPPCLTQPYLYIHATRDIVFSPKMIQKLKNLPRNIVDSMEVREVNTTHWAMIESPGDVNGILKEWIERVCLGGGRVGGSKL